MTNESFKDVEKLATDESLRELSSQCTIELRNATTQAEVKVFIVDKLLGVTTAATVYSGGAVTRVT